MELRNSKGTSIVDHASWEKAFLEVDDQKHWKTGRSACSLAVFFSSPNVSNSQGCQLIKDYLKSIGFDCVQFEKAEIEHESRFDKYQGKGRMQDLSIWAKSSNGLISINIEAKVDETFDETITEKYIIAKNHVLSNPRSKQKIRLEEICKKFYPQKEISDLSAIRYQLLYYLAGSIEEAKKINGIAYLPIMVFHTEDFDEKKGEYNKEDYYSFIKSLDFSCIQPEKGIYYKNIEGIDVFLSYMIIDIKP